MQAEVRVAVWEYRDAEDRRRRAYFGDTVELSEDEYARAERAGVFAAAAPPEPVGTVVNGLIDIVEPGEDQAHEDQAPAEPEVIVGEGGGGAGGFMPGTDPSAPTVVFTDGSPEQPAEPAEVEPPKRAALKEQWVTYAVHRGMPQEEAEAMTRAELIEKFGQA